MSFFCVRWKRRLHEKSWVISLPLSMFIHGSCFSWALAWRLPMGTVEYCKKRTMLLLLFFYFLLFLSYYGHHHRAHRSYYTRPPQMHICVRNMWGTALHACIVEPLSEFELLCMIYVCFVSKLGTRSSQKEKRWRIKRKGGNQQCILHTLSGEKKNVALNYYWTF